MGKMLRNEKAFHFFEQMQGIIHTGGNLVENVGGTIADIAEELHIGMVEVRQSAPQSKLRSSIEMEPRVLYRSEEPVGKQPFKASYRTGDNGTAEFSCYPVIGYTWDEEELRELRIVCNETFSVFSQDAMRGLLDRTLFMDLHVGIPNVTGFMKFVGPLFAKGEIRQYDAFYINVHNFKYVNKVLSYGRADDVMKSYARKLAEAVGEDECVARLGGDNFVALVRLEHVERFLKLVNDVDVVYEQDETVKKFHFGATIGAAHLDEATNPGELMNYISIAYQIARRREAGGVIYYNDDICQEVMHQKEVIANFEKALKKKEFVVYYQPKVTTADKQICGAEALVRWQKPDGLVPPAAFIPTLERDGSICRLDFYVLDKACEMLSRFRWAGIPLVRISVNFSKKHMEDADLVQNIVAVIDKHGIPHEYLEIELTESENFKDYELMSRIINGLRAEGIGTSIDDFGTGYSSLNMLKMTNVDLLKIDKSFVPMDENRAYEEKDVLMFESIARMAKALEIQIIAEGVETEEQYEYLKSAGCDMIQGYYFDKPLPEIEFLERICKGHY